jgi:hypothetical protein
MLATESQVADLRIAIGEPIEETESIFDDELVSRWVEEEPTLNHAALRGWKAKMAYYANLVDTVDGAAARNMSDLFAHAQDMVTFYSKQVRGVTFGRARVGKIVRPS